MTRHHLDPKDPSEVLDYAVNLTAELTRVEDTIAEVTWTVPDGLTQPRPSSSTDTVATVWLGGGTAGEEYEVTASITTEEGRLYERTLRILVLNL